MATIHSSTLVLLLVISVGRIRSNPIADHESQEQVGLILSEGANAKVVNEPRPFSYDFLLSLAVMSKPLLAALKKELVETATEAPAAQLRKSSLAEDPLVKSLLTLFVKEDTSKEILKFVDMLNLRDDQNPMGMLRQGGIADTIFTLISRRNKFRKYKNLVRRSGPIFLHAASIGTSIAALSTAIALTSSAAHKAKSHQHQFELADEYILEPIFHRLSNFEFDSGAHHQLSSLPFDPETLKRKLDTTAVKQSSPHEQSLETSQRATNRELKISALQTSYSAVLEKVMKFINDYQRAATGKENITGLST